MQSECWHCQSNMSELNSENNFNVQSGSKYLLFMSRLATTHLLQFMLTKIYLLRRGYIYEVSLLPMLLINYTKL